MKAPISVTNGAFTERQPLGLVFVICFDPNGCPLDYRLRQLHSIACHPSPRGVWVPVFSGPRRGSARKETERARRRARAQNPLQLKGKLGQHGALRLRYAFPAV